MQQILLSGKRLKKTFSNATNMTPVLRDLDVEIYKGDFTIIMGASGAGKSTLLYILSGMDSLTDGQIFYKDKQISHYSQKQLAELRVSEFGFVFQQTHLVSNLTLLENVLVASYLNHMRSEHDSRQEVQDLLIKMQIEYAANRFPSQTSGGEAQRAAIARAVINHPEILFADEPTGALNRKNTEKVLELFTLLNREGQSIVMVTHDLRCAIRGNRILYLEDGEILDELKLQPYTDDNIKNREKQINQWLSSLTW